MPDVPIPRRHSNASDERAMKSALEASPRTIIKDSKPTCETHVPPHIFRTATRIPSSLDTLILVRSS